MAELSCPYCGGANVAPAELSRAIVDCSHCERSFALPRAGGARVASRAARAQQALRATSPTDVGLGMTGAAALVLTFVFYVGLVRPLQATYFGELFGARGWVPYVIAWLSVWAGLLLGVKAWLLVSQRRVLDLDLLPEAIAAKITPANASIFASHLRELAASTPRSFLVERLERALEHFRIRRTTRDVVEQLGSQAQLDAGAVESSYTMVRVFIWAIPILGFIGTVLGISSAVAGFSDSVAEAVDLEVMKHSIGAVTSGLCVAFDTTLLALVMSIFIMFPASSLQKAEEDFLAHVEVYCDEQLGRRLDESVGALTSDPLQAGLGGAGAGVGRLEVQIARLAGSIDSLEERLALAKRQDRESKGDQSPER